MSAVVRPTGAARGGNNNSIICAAPAPAAAHHCFTITPPPLGSLGATDTAHKLHSTLLRLPSIKRSITSREGSVFNLSCSLLAYFLLILASFPRGHSRTNVVAPSRDTATDGDERARVRKSAAPEVAAAVQWWDGRDSFPATCQLAPGNTLI